MDSLTLLARLYDQPLLVDVSESVEIILSASKYRPIRTCSHGNCDFCDLKQPDEEICYISLAAY